MNAALPPLPEIEAKRVGASLAEFRNDPATQGYFERRGLPRNFDVTRCPNCGDHDMGVVDSRQTDALGPMTTRRTRQCGKCRGKITTVEINSTALMALLDLRDNATVHQVAAHLRDLAERIDPK